MRYERNLKEREGIMVEKFIFDKWGDFALKLQQMLH
jgi:hypothetical protein